MKNKIYCFVLVFFLGFIAKSQTYEILNSAGGELTDFKNLYDDDNLFGYFELHKLNEINEKTTQYKYIVLDKNFNKIATNEFEVSKITKYQELSQAIYNKGKILLGFSELLKGKSANKQYCVIDIKTSTVSPPFVLQNSELQLLEKSVLENIKEQKYNEGGLAYKVKDKGFLLADRSYIGYKSFIKTGVFVDLEGKQKWNLNLKKGKTENEFYEYDFIANDEKSIALRANLFKKKKYIDSNLMIIDAESGEITGFEPYWDKEYSFVLGLAKFVNDDLVMTGEYYEKTINTELPDVTRKRGVYKKSVSRTDGTTKQRQLLPFNMLSEYVKINDLGRVSKDGFLDFKDFEIRPDGTNLIFGETYKSDFMSGANKFTELFYLVLDQNFKPITMKSSEVNNTFYSKYMYGQSLQNNKGYASFFIDKGIDKKLVLNILVYNDATQTFKRETLELEKKNEDTWFFAAKNGYIGLIDYYKKDKNNPQGKQAELHLEKINID